MFSRLASAGPALVVEGSVVTGRFAITCNNQCTVAEFAEEKPIGITFLS